jgi:hypothetical protein
MHAFPVLILWNEGRNGISFDCKMQEKSILSSYQINTSIEGTSKIDESMFFRLLLIFS